MEGHNMSNLTKQVSKINKQWKKRQVIRSVASDVEGAVELLCQAMDRAPAGSHLAKDVEKIWDEASALQAALQDGCEDSDYNLDGNWKQKGE